MNESFSPYPLMGNSLFQKIGYVTDKAERENILLTTAATQHII